MKRLNRYLNPIERLGKGEYSFLFPFIANISLCILSEIFAYGIARNPLVVGVYIIFFNTAFVIYFSFRDGILGGIMSAVIAMLYYFYIISSRHYSAIETSTGVDTTLELGVIYILLAVIIGWLKQTIDKLIGREANEKIWLQMILQQLAVGVIITDNKGKVVQTNKQVEQILGVKIPQGFLMGKDKALIRSAFTNQLPNSSESPIYQALKTGKPTFGQEFAISRRDGKKAYIQVSSSTIKNKKKKVIAAASIISDITQQKELEQQKDDFLSMASHELKTPITSLKMFIDLERQQIEEQNTQKAKYFNERVMDQANKLKELTNDLLDVSRIQTNKLRFTIEDFNIASVIHETIEGLQAEAKGHEINVKRVKKYHVKADRYRVYQVLVNLISNAIKYSPADKKIFIETKADKRNVIVSVADSGIGIGKPQQQKIFDRLYQVTDPHEKTFPGLGLGLYISKEIIERHNGKIWVKSAKGKGSTFFFSLPLYIQKN